MEEPARDGDGPVPDRRPQRLWQRRRPLTVVGLACFFIGLPMVSIEDGIVLSSLGLFLELLALLCLLFIVFALVDEGRAEGGGEHHR